MYEFIAGTVDSRSATAVLIEAAGVGYELLAPLGAPFPPPGQPAKVHVHFVVREDSQTLYGFPTRDMRELFRILLKVRGVGPSMGLGILSGLGPAEIAHAVIEGDVKAFTGVKGVGKKTAEQILLDLRDKELLLSSLAGDKTVSQRPTPEPRLPEQHPNVSDAVAALVSIGYSEKEALKKVETAMNSAGTDDLESLVRAAMRV